MRQRRGSRFLPLVVVGVVGVHVVVSWVWAVGVRKLGLSAVTWAVSVGWQLVFGWSLTRFLAGRA